MRSVETHPYASYGEPARLSHKADISSVVRQGLSSLLIGCRIERLSGLRSHFVLFNAIFSSCHFILNTVLEKRSQMTGYWLVTSSYFACVLANLKLFPEILLLVKVIAIVIILQVNISINNVSTTMSINDIFKYNDDYNIICLTLKKQLLNYCT